jgi:hypothetical protein
MMLFQLILCVNWWQVPNTNRAECPSRIEKGTIVRLGRDILQLFGFILIVTGIGLMMNRDTYLPMLRQYVPAATPELILSMAVICLAFGAYLVARRRPVEL